MNPYDTFVSGTCGLLREAAGIPLGGELAVDAPRVAPGAPRALIFSPHPDDEVIIGGLALRMLRECGWDVRNVAVTQGSNAARKEGRWAELQSCCKAVGFGLIQTAPGGLDGISLKTREGDPGAWARSVARIAEILGETAPSMLLVPHARDWNSTHIGTHHLVMDALAEVGAGFLCEVIETEFWAPMETPNLMVEISERDLADLIHALSLHVGEVRRNPYHLRLPAWMIDNVRRGGELVGGQGGAAPDFAFATLYRWSRWDGAGLRPALERGRFVAARDDLKALFGS